MTSTTSDLEILEFFYPGFDKPELFRPRKNGSSFENPFSSWREPNVMTFIKWKTGSMKVPPSGFPKVPTQEQIDEFLPRCFPSFGSVENSKQGMSITWLGHSTCVLEIDSIALITDPIFSQHCAPPLVQKLAQQSWLSSLGAGIKRFLDLPCSVSDLPENLRFVLISHNHYDHLDTQSCQEIANRYGDRVMWCVPLGLGATMQSILPDFCHNQIFELEWWRGLTFKFHRKNPSATFHIVATPSQHWSGRNMVTDKNKSLWASWVVLSESNKRFFFAGDTGYCDAFKQIGDVFGPFDLAAIPIGAFEPREIMAPQHIGPEEAVAIHKDIKSSLSIGIHWGTFPMADEGFLDAQVQLMELAQPASGVEAKEIKSCQNNTISLVEMVRKSKLKISFVTLNCGQTYRVADDDLATS